MLDSKFMWLCWVVPWKSQQMAAVQQWAELRRWWAGVLDAPRPWLSRAWAISLQLRHTSAAVPSEACLPGAWLDLLEWGHMSLHLVDCLLSSHLDGVYVVPGCQWRAACWWVNHRTSCPRLGFEIKWSSYLAYRQNTKQNKNADTEILNMQYL
jgi:hypothetical protein